MRVIRTIGIANVILGVIFAIVPIQFFKMVRTVFSPPIQPPFGWGTVWTIAILLWIPTLALIISGAALILVEDNFVKVPKYDVFTDTGKFLGRVKGVKAPEGVTESFVVDEEEGEEEILKEDVIAEDEVLIVKEERTKKHSALGKEVYTEVGEFLGYVKDVKLDPQEDIEEIEVRRGEISTTVKKDDIISIDRVILVK
ncbi:MAG: PRC-barrel domain-containing protein [Candidatus Hydrothermarchaeales archaeon]